MSGLQIAGVQAETENQLQSRQCGLTGNQTCNLRMLQLTEPQGQGYLICLNLSWPVTALTNEVKWK